MSCHAVQRDVEEDWYFVGRFFRNGTVRQSNDFGLI